MNFNINYKTLIIAIIFILLIVVYIGNKIYNNSHTFQKTITIKSKNKDYRYGRYMSKNYKYYLVDSYDIKYELNMSKNILQIYDSINVGDVIEIKGSYNMYDSLLNIDELITKNST